MQNFASLAGSPATSCQSVVALFAAVAMVAERRLKEFDAQEFTRKTLAIAMARSLLVL